MQAGLGFRDQGLGLRISGADVGHILSPRKANPLRLSRTRRDLNQSGNEP